MTVLPLALSGCSSRVSSRTITLPDRRDTTALHCTPCASYFACCCCIMSGIIHFLDSDLMRFRKSRTCDAVKIDSKSHEDLSLLSTIRILQKRARQLVPGKKSLEQDHVVGICLLFLNDGLVVISTNTLDRVRTVLIACWKSSCFHSRCNLADVFMT